MAFGLAAFGLAMGLTLSLTGVSAADDLVAAEQVSGTSVGFVLTGSHRNATLSISGPNGFHASTFSRGGAVAVDLGQFGHLPDGAYNYQLTAASNVAVAIEGGLDNGRGRDRRSVASKPAAKSGTFNVRGGRIVDYGIAATRGRRDRDSAQ
jgi:hypothetical protein